MAEILLVAAETFGATDERSGARHNIRVAAYRVVDPVTKEPSPIQFHMTMDNMVFAVMPQSAASLFVRFAGEVLRNAENPAGKDA